MAGLLDPGGPFDLSNPQTQMAFGLLMGAQAPRSQGAQIFSGLLSQQAAMKQQDMQRKLTESQIEENALQNRQREMQMQNALAQQARENAFFGLGGAQPTTQGAGMISGGSPGGLSSSGGANSTGAAPSANKFDEWSQQFGIPRDALMVDYFKNGGKGIAEMIAKRGTPDMQVTNGYAYDKNKLGAGFMPSLSTSQDGKTSMVRIGPDGLPVVSAPQGAADTYAMYQGAQAAFKPIKVYNPATGREEYTNERAVVQPQSAPANVRPQAQYAGPGYAGGSANAAAQGQLEVMQSELNKLPANHPDRPAIMREMQRLGGGQAATQMAPQSGNYAAGPSAAESAANEAQRVQAVEQVKADISPTATKVTALDTARDALGMIDQALRHPGLKTATGIQGTLDPRNYIPGTDATNFRVLMDQVKGSVFLDAYKDLRGGGAITDIEGTKAEAAKARINRAQSPDEFIKGLNEYKAIVQRGYERAAARAGGQGGATGGWDESPAKPVATMRFNPSTGRLEKVN